jgi:hypothetical protein
MPSLPTSSLWQNSFAKYYPRKSRLPKVREQFWMCVREVCLPVVLSSLILMWPIEVGSTESGKMSDVSFGVFQAIYVAIAVPLVLYNLREGAKEKEREIGARRNFRV